MKIMGIDQSYTSSGIAIIEDGTYVFCERYCTSKTFSIFERSRLIANYIVTLAEQYKPERIGIEGLAFGMRGDATRDLAGLQFTIINALELKGFTVDIIAPNAVKKFATGDGRAKKEQLFEALPKSTQKKFLDLGVKKTTGLYDLTDAWFIAQFAYEKSANEDP